MLLIVFGTSCLVWENVALKKQKEQLHQDHLKLDQLIKYNRKIVIDNEMFLYSIKENYLLLYDHYNIISKLLSAGLNDEIDYSKLHTHMSVAQDNALRIEQYFTSTFKLTPKEYRLTKRIVGSKPNGDTEDTGFSQN